jgi:hypothetical protein
MVILSLLGVGCTHFKSVEVNDRPGLKTAYEEVHIEASYCRGKGQIVSSGDINGRLNFTFSTSRDTAYIQFTDLIGRKAIFMVLVNDDATVWDMIHNEQFDLATTLLRFPFLEVIKPADLRQFLWGKVPESIQKGMLNTPETMETGAIQFHSELTEYGPLVTKINFVVDERQKVDLTISKREFGSTYPHLERGIPSAIPLSEMD